MTTPVNVPAAIKRARKAQILPVQRAQAGFAKRFTEPFDIIALGDSLTEGARVSTLENHWTAKLRDKLRARYPVPGVVGGQGYLKCSYYSSGSDALGSVQAFTLVGGTVYASALFGLGRRSYIMSAAGHKMTATGVVCSSVDLVFTRGTTDGSVQIKIDGVVTETYSTIGSTQAGTRHNLGPLTPGPHDFEFSWASGGLVIVEGMMVYNGDETKGIRMWEGGMGGVKSDFYNIDLGVTYWQTIFTTVQPKLVIIEESTNDWWYNSGVVSGGYGNYSSAAAKANKLSQISAIYSLCATKPTIALVTAHDRGDAGTIAGTVPLEPWSNYVAKDYEIAAADPNVLVIDMQNAMGPAPYTAGNPSYGLVHADKVHLVDAGAEHWADTIFRALTGGAF